MTNTRHLLTIQRKRRTPVRKKEVSWISLEIFIRIVLLKKRKVRIPAKTLLQLMTIL